MPVRCLGTRSTRPWRPVASTLCNTSWHLTNKTKSLTQYSGSGASPPKLPQQQQLPNPVHAAVQAAVQAASAHASTNMATTSYQQNDVSCPNCTRNQPRSQCLRTHTSVENRPWPYPLQQRGVGEIDVVKGLGILLLMGPCWRNGRNANTHTRRGSKSDGHTTKQPMQQHRMRWQNWSNLMGSHLLP